MDSASDSKIERIRAEAEELRAYAARLEHQAEDLMRSELGRIRSKQSPAPEAQSTRVLSSEHRSPTVSPDGTSARFSDSDFVIMLQQSRALHHSMLPNSEFSDSEGGLIGDEEFEALLELDMLSNPRSSTPSARNSASNTPAASSLNTPRTSKPSPHPASQFHPLPGVPLAGDGRAEQSDRLGSEAARARAVWAGAAARAEARIRGVSQSAEVQAAERTSSSASERQRRLFNVVAHQFDGPAHKHETDKESYYAKRGRKLRKKHAFHHWRSQAWRLGKLRTISSRVIRRWIYRASCEVFNAWQEYMSRSQRLRLAVRKAVMRWSHLLVAVPFETWHQAAIWLRIMRSVGAKVMNTWVMRTLKKGVERWKEFTTQIRRTKCLLLRVVNRWTRKTLLRFWTSWIQAVCEAAKAEEMRDLEQSFSVSIQRHKERHIHGLRSRVLGRWTKQSQTKALFALQACVLRAKRLRNCFKRSALRWKKIQVSVPFNTWKEATHKAKQVKRLRSRVLSKWLSSGLARAYEQWKAFRVESNRLRRVILRVINQWQVKTLVICFGCWSAEALTSKNAEVLRSMEEKYEKHLQEAKDQHDREMRDELQFVEGQYHLQVRELTQHLSKDLKAQEAYESDLKFLREALGKAEKLLNAEKAELAQIREQLEESRKASETAVGTISGLRESGFRALMRRIAHLLNSQTLRASFRAWRTRTKKVQNCARAGATLMARCRHMALSTAWAQLINFQLSHKRFQNQILDKVVRQMTDQRSTSKTFMGWKIKMWDARHWRANNGRLAQLDSRLEDLRRRFLRVGKTTPKEIAAMIREYETEAQRLELELMILLSAKQQQTFPAAQPQTTDKTHFHPSSQTLRATVEPSAPSATSGFNPKGRQSPHSVAFAPAVREAEVGGASTSTQHGSISPNPAKAFNPPQLAGHQIHHLQSAQQSISNTSGNPQGLEDEPGSSEDEDEDEGGISTKRHSGDISGIQFSRRMCSPAMQQPTFDDDEDEDGMESDDSDSEDRARSSQDISGVDFSSRLQTRRIQDHELADDTDESEDEAEFETAGQREIQYSRRSPGFKAKNSLRAPGGLTPVHSEGVGSIRSSMLSTEEAEISTLKFGLGRNAWTAIIEGARWSRKLRLLLGKVSKLSFHRVSKRDLEISFIAWAAQVPIKLKEVGGDQRAELEMETEGLEAQADQLRERLSVAEQSLRAHGLNVVAMRL